jgi:exosortase B
MYVTSTNKVSVNDRRIDAAAFALGVAVMYGPTLWGAARTLWTSEDQAHGPLVIAVSAWWFWHLRRELRAALGPGAGLGAWLLLLLGALMYAIGRAQQIWTLEIGSCIPVLSGGIATLFGWRAVRTVRFAILFLFFAIPLPGALVDELTAPLKRGVSIAAEELLYLAGYPVARDGVVLSLGQYKLLIASACSGLYSMTSLFALAVVYVNVARRAGPLRNAVILFTSLPVAVAANVMRVILLGLITYYWGDAAGQGFLHGAAGIVMLTISLTLIFVGDTLLARWWPENGYGASAAASGVASRAH